MHAVRSTVATSFGAGRNRTAKQAKRNGTQTCAAFALEAPPYELVRTSPHANKTRHEGRRRS